MRSHLARQAALTRNVEDAVGPRFNPTAARFQHIDIEHLAWSRLTPLRPRRLCRPVSPLRGSQPTLCSERGTGGTVKALKIALTIEQQINIVARRKTCERYGADGDSGKRADGSRLKLTSLCKAARGRKPGWAFRR